MELALLSAINQERAARRAVVAVTDLTTGKQRLVRQNDVANDPLAALLTERLRTGKSGLEETAEGRVFLAVHVPSLRLVITGAVHISQALVPMSHMLGYDITIVDPRSAFASPERFADARVIADWPDNVLPSLAMDSFTAFVALAHDPKIDDPGLVHALLHGCFYVGALGSRKSHERRIARLLSLGISQTQVDRIRGPVGLDIGAISPAEIAVSILSEITACRRGAGRWRA